MKWIEILRKDEVALLQSENDIQYVVATGYNPNAPEDQQWANGNYFSYGLFGKNENLKTLYLASALDCFRQKVEENFIPRCRLEELATQFKDGLIEDGRESAMEFFNEVCEMEDYEKEFFGIDEGSPLANTKFENPMYNKGYDDGFSDAMNDKEE